MATYLLRPHDGGKDIAIPSGKTTIGRGPFLGVSDKRVSRSHAVLELRDGNLTVLPLHANPTFYKAGVKEKFVALKRNEVQDLVSGNVISLLPDALCFEIVYEESLSKNGLTTEEENSSKSRTTADKLSPVVADDHEKPSTSSKVPSESFLDEFLDNRPSLETGPVSQASKDKKDSNEFLDTRALKDKKESNEFLETQVLKDKKESNEFPDASSVTTTSKENTVSPSKPLIIPAPLLQKTRKLPSWLIKSTSSEMRSPAKKEGNKNEKGPTSNTGNKTATPSKGGKTAKKSSSLPQKKQVRSTSDEEFIASDDKESRTLKKKGKKTTIPRKRTSTDIQESDDDIKPTRHKKTKRALSDDDDDDVPIKPAESQAKPAKPVVTAKDELSSGSEEDVKPVASEKRKETKMPKKDRSATSTRPFCPYGSKCYRKNPLHFKEYSHHNEDSKADSDDDDDNDKAAGDSDEADDDRPECPFGTSCYRKKPQHKRDFKHTEAPGRPKRKKSKQKSVLNNESDDDGPNTYDYNDSFLDDGDDAEGSGSSYSAGSDDSDWQPQGGDDDDEDVTELLTEARGFLRSKKMAKPI